MYYAYELTPEDRGDLAEFIKLEGAVSQEGPIGGNRYAESDLARFFPTIGKLQTAGPTISLPFCWFSQIDTWDNPSLCAVDSYDLSQDRVRFVGRVINRPDLVPIAKAIDYAQARDYPAVLAYCSSAEVAQAIVNRIPTVVYAGPEVNVTAVSAHRERVELGDGPVYKFEVDNSDGQWKVLTFRIE